jgi:alkylhydroperoxidase family enzyme
LLGDKENVKSVVADFRSAPISDAEKALFAFIEKANAQAHEIRQGDIDEAKRAGWSDEALYDAITVCSLFNFYNRWNDANGTRDMSPADYEEQGRRMAKNGYIMD